MALALQAKVLYNDDGTLGAAITGFAPNTEVRMPVGGESPAAIKAAFLRWAKATDLRDDPDVKAGTISVTVV